MAAGCLMTALTPQQLAAAHAGQCLLIAGAHSVGVAGVGYAGLMALVIWQALHGQPLVAPDAATLLALVGFLSAMAVAAGGVVLQGRRRHHFLASTSDTLP